MARHTLLKVSSPTHQALVPITREVGAAVRELDLRDGVLHLFVRHTTCGLTINENADPDVARDLIGRLEKLVPWHDADDRHMEGNTAAHLRSLITGTSLTVPVQEYKLQLGTWQGIYMAEFDGPRTRHIHLTALTGEE